MKFRLALPLALALLVGTTFLTACGDEVADAKDAAKGITDAVSDFSPTAASVTTMVSDLGSKLGSIKDLASASAITGELGPLLDKLSKAKSLLGDKMPDLGSLDGVVNTLKSKFAGDSAVMKVLDPILKKITGLIG